MRERGGEGGRARAGQVRGPGEGSRVSESSNAWQSPNVESYVETCVESVCRVGFAMSGLSGLSGLVSINVGPVLDIP